MYRIFMPNLLKQSDGVFFFLLGPQKKFFLSCALQQWKWFLFLLDLRQPDWLTDPLLFHPKERKREGWSFRRSVSWRETGQPPFSLLVRKIGRWLSRFRKVENMFFRPPFFFLLRRFLCSSFSRFRKIYKECADMETRGKFTAAPRLPFGENRHINIKGDRRRLRLPSKPRKRKKLRLQWRREAPRCTTIRKKDPFLLLLGRQKFVPTCVCLSLSLFRRETNWQSDPSFNF